MMSSEPDYGAALGLINHLPTEELRDLVNNDDKLTELVKDLPQMKNLANEQEILLAANKSLAEFNLSLEPKLSQVNSLSPVEERLMLQEVNTLKGEVALPNASPPSLYVPKPPPSPYSHLALPLQQLSSSPSLYHCPNHLNRLTLTWHFHSNSSPNASPPSLLFTCPNHLIALLSPGTSTPTALPNASPPSLLFTCPNHLHRLTLTWHFHSNSSLQCLTTFSPLHVPKPPQSPYSHLALPLQQLSQCLTTFSPLHVPKPPPNRLTLTWHFHSNSSPQCLTTFSPLHVPETTSIALLSPGTSTPTALPNASPPSLLFTCPNHLNRLTLTWHFHSNSSPQCLTTFSPLHVPKPPQSPYSHLALPLQQLSPMPHHLLSSSRAQTTSIALLSPGTSTPTALPNASPPSLYVPKPPQ
ncbi:hypothetical protein GWK47_044787 [Chionoecetes opilio]|uniref:VPS37 C-terminal domain-containing protein n=1 Tax=Chionoecetes opilio TaxID=41210 RepID=A0A8J4YFI3_CHIOP|nr:hypothetical protein GWK47_044787 [Chionoecetes opilio]